MPNKEDVAAFKDFVPAPAGSAPAAPVAPPGAEAQSQPGKDYPEHATGKRRFDANPDRVKRGRRRSASANSQSSRIGTDHVNLRSIVIICLHSVSRCLGAEYCSSVELS